jgi:Glyoxalase-like domain
MSAARAITSATVTSETIDCNIIVSFAHRGPVSRRVDDALEALQSLARLPKTGHPYGVASFGLVLDCSDPDKLAEFWSGALGWQTLGGAGSAASADISRT